MSDSVPINVRHYFHCDRVYGMQNITVTRSHWLRTIQFLVVFYSCLLLILNGNWNWNYTIRKCVCQVKLGHFMDTEFLSDLYLVSAIYFDDCVRIEIPSRCYFEVFMWKLGDFVFTKNTFLFLFQLRSFWMWADNRAQIRIGNISIWNATNSNVEGRQ